ncbi:MULTISPECIES: TRAP transporter large permease [Rhizobium/Agrobacterium group]|jgi:tripartite ATP-independent transporter DctM subunit|uniref:TRAP transporter large permease protein n=1 Tax=Agrobacterium tumefaciens TaxID=358 RepID=A0AAJ4N745_AGRTU|nr:MULTISPECIES: TRAP transporter large permease subunit [Rhizobium/Agrobacterium group]AYM14459.1 C4-dicarboxylate ABC transporter [Agrobacterium tumefaciens]MBO9112249.1 TRAP transporter large permease subunit [Agrobacterium sp. S2/73]NSY10044.1 TRAP transporter large permease subunit [Agrobacterium tumefaciens]NSY93572.1 TRAP transporter large permease subunit [Agrobacterium tumefaciens]NSZ09530.1 TRAP transporter large permease subunit [Agrobacterium tumefaciens]
MAFLAENLAPIMFAALIIVLLLGYPVAFALAFVGFFFGFIGIELGLLPATLFQAIPDRIFGQMSNETLLAIPFFTFMGLILEKSGMAEDLLDTIGQLFGPVRGGIAFAVIFVGAILAATTGVVAASVISMGLISLPIMLRYGYDRKIAAGTIAASGTLAQIIPPSLVLIVLADQLGRSVGDMYKGALVPGLLLVGAYTLYIIVTSIISPAKVPALPLEARTLRGSKLLLKVITSLVPPLVLIFLVLGTIFLGIATPTEGGAMGAVGALALALANGKLNLGLIQQSLYATAKLSSFVLLILLGARVFSLTFYGVNGHVWVEHLMTSVPGGEIGFLIVANLLVFFLAFFLDYFELAFIIIPLLAPVADALGIDLIWFGVMLAVNMQTSFMHPPFGFSLFFLRSVAPTRAYKDRITGQTIQPITSSQIYLGAIPYLFIQLAMVIIIIAFPGIVMHYKSGAKVADPSAVHINVPMPGAGTDADPFANPFLAPGNTAPSFGKPSTP